MDAKCYSGGMLSELMLLRAHIHNSFNQIMRTVKVLFESFFHVLWRLYAQFPTEGKHNQSEMIFLCVHEA